MKYGWLILLLSANLVSCANSPGARKPAAEGGPEYLPALNDGKAWGAGDPALKQGDLTVWKLQEMAQKGDFATLNQLFNHGLTMNHLPVGYSAGAGAPFPSVNNNQLASALEHVTGLKWRGKIFFDSGDAIASHGFNRILKVPPGRKVLPTAKFTTFLLFPNSTQNVFDQPQLARGATSNFVVLNYAHPIADPSPNWLVEKILTKVPVFDVMVAVPGKYGPLYVGKTWYGAYDKKSDAFHASNPESLIAWYFLDFNQGALDEQMSSHWDGGTEQKINTIDGQK